MLADIWQWIPFHTWLSLASLVVGSAVIAPLLLSRAFRQRVKGTGPDDVEGLGLALLVVAVVGIGLYNYFGASAGA